MGVGQEVVLVPSAQPLGTILVLFLSQSHLPLPVLLIPSLSISVLVSVPSSNTVSVLILWAVSSFPPPTGLSLPAQGVFSCQLLLCAVAKAEEVI